MKTFFANLRKSMANDPVAATFMLLAAIFFGFGLGWGVYQNWLKPPIAAGQNNLIQHIQQAPVVCCLGQLKTVATMQPGDRCVLPENMFLQAGRGKLGPDALPVIESEDGKEFIPAGAPVLCTPQAPKFGLSYIRKIKGPTDSEPWYRIYVPGNTQTRIRALAGMPENEKSNLIAVDDGMWGEDN